MDELLNENENQQQQMIEGKSNYINFFNEAKPLTLLYTLLILNIYIYIYIFYIVIYFSLQFLSLKNFRSA